MYFSVCTLTPKLSSYVIYFWSSSFFCRFGIIGLLGVEVTSLFTKNAVNNAYDIRKGNVCQFRSFCLLCWLNRTHQTLRAFQRESDFYPRDALLARSLPLFCHELVLCQNEES